MITITTRLNPIGKGRPIRGAHGTMRTPEKTRIYENALKQAAREQYKGKPLRGPLRVLVEARMPIPASWSKKRKDAALGQPHTSKPDIDNIAKTLDAFNEILWCDDAQIYWLTVSKVYSDAPGLTVSISPLSEATQERAHSNILYDHSNLSGR